MFIRKPEWPDARGWIGVGSWLLTVGIFILIVSDKSLLNSDAFLILATAVVITGWVNGPVTWAYGSTKGGGELADKNQEIVNRVANPNATLPQEVKVTNTPSNPVNTTDTGSYGELPEDAKL